MEAIFRNNMVITRCPDCGGATSNYLFTGTVHAVGPPHEYKEKNYSRTVYALARCAGCDRGGLAKIHDQGNMPEGVMEWFYPTATTKAAIPKDVPSGIEAEYREAELCASVGAWRAASGLLRSTLEKTLKENGYKKGNLKDKIDDASKEGIITESRRKRAHEDIRVLGNDVLHDEWREVDPEEVSTAHHYIQRILEDFYDDRASVETVLLARRRISTPSEE